MEVFLHIKGSHPFVIAFVSWFNCWMERTAYIAFGGNIGDKQAVFRAAIDGLGALESTRVVRVSDSLETAPAGGPAGQGNYLNAAIEIRTSLEPDELLRRLHDIERNLGRNRPAEQRWGPRTCDLDIMLMDDIVMNTPALTIPHPRLHERAFMLRPLAQIAPDVRHPVLNATITELLARQEGTQ